MKFVLFHLGWVWQTFSATEQGWSSPISSLCCFVSSSPLWLSVKIDSSVLWVSIREFSTTNCRLCKLHRNIYSLVPLRGDPEGAGNAFPEVSCDVVVGASNVFIREHLLVAGSCVGLSSRPWGSADSAGPCHKALPVHHPPGCPLGLQEESSSNPSPWQPFPSSRIREAESERLPICHGRLLSSESLWLIWTKDLPAASQVRSKDCLQIGLSWIRSLQFDRRGDSHEHWDHF